MEYVNQNEKSYVVLIMITIIHRSTKNLVYPVLLFYKRHISLYSEGEDEGEGEGVRIIINVFQKTWAKGLRGWEV